MDFSFVNEDFKARKVACLFWSSIFSLTYLIGIIALLNISISFPWTWMYDTLCQIFTFGSFFSMIFSIISVAAFMNIIEPCLSLSDCIYSKRHHLINRICCGKIFKHSLLCGLLGGFTAWWMNAFLLDYDFSTLFISNPFNDGSIILSRTYLLFIYFGIFCGFIFGAKFFLFNMQNITFNESLCDNNFLSSMYGYVLSKLVDSVKLSFYHTVCFYPAFLFAISFTEIFLNLFYISISDEFSYGFPSLDVVILMFIFGYYLEFSWSIASELLKQYFSKSLRIPLTSIISSEETVQLYLQQPPDGLAKYLVYKRLHEICEYDVKSRKMVYSLSELGGHPHLWNLIHKTCQRELGALLKRVNESNCRLIAKGNLPSAVALQHKLLPKNLRIRLHVSDLSPLKKPSNKSCCKKPIVDLALDYLVALKMVRFFTDPLPFSDTVNVFSECQVVIWCCEILRSLVCASIDEDDFGVVQKDLGAVITLLCELNESVGKHLKLSGLFGITSNFSLSPETDAFYSDPKLIWKMKNTLIEAITSIVRTFGSDIDAIQMSPTTRQLLDPFKESAIKS